MKDSLYGQFILYQGARPLPPRYTEHQLGPWRLGVHPLLPVHRLHGPSGPLEAVFLGYPIREGKLRVESGPMHTPLSPESTPAEIEALLADTPGRYLLVWLCGSPCAYPDPCGTLAAVFSQEQGCLASTTSLVHYSPEDSGELPRGSYPDIKPNLYFPGGLTDREDCRRLMPNHRLELDTWTLNRFWPREVIEPEPEEALDRNLNRVADVLRDTMRCLYATDLVNYGTLTAGRDTRMMLACTPPEIRDRVTYVTIEFPEDQLGHRQDVHIARRVAKRLGLNHRVIPAGDAREDDCRAYLYRIGLAGTAGKARKFYRPPLDHLDLNAVWPMGLGGGTVRIKYAGVSENGGMPSARDILQHSGLPLRDDFVEATGSWLRGLPRRSTPELAAFLLYLEFRVGGWAAPHFYGMAPFRAGLIPFSNRRFIEAAMTLPYEFRNQGKRPKEFVVRAADPAAGFIPYDTLTGLAAAGYRLTHNRFTRVYRRRQKVNR